METREPKRPVDTSPTPREEEHVKAYTTVLDRRRLAERSSDLRLKVAAMDEAIDEHEEIARRLGVATRIDDVMVDETDLDSLNEATRVIVSRTRECQRLAASMGREQPAAPPTTEKEWGLEQIVRNVKTGRTDKYAPPSWGTEP
jgi:hypothetical protein